MRGRDIILYILSVIFIFIRINRWKFLIKNDMVSSDTGYLQQTALIDCGSLIIIKHDQIHNTDNAAIISVF